MNDSDFVAGLHQRDPAAVQHLTQCYLPSVWRFVYARVSGDRHLAEDIVSEVVLALMRAAGGDSDIQSPGAWLRAVAHHKIQDHFRAAARVQHLIDQVKGTQVAEQQNAADQHELLERRREIRHIMDALPERHRMLLEWKYIEKLSVREMAERLSITEKAVESILFRARRQFRDKLAAHQKKVSHPAPNALRPGDIERSKPKPAAEESRAIEKRTGTSCLEGS